MNRIVGVIGGMGPWASLHMVRVLLQACRVVHEQDYPHIILDADASIPDRTAAILSGGEDPYPQILASGRRLLGMGAGLLVMACNTAHYWHVRLAEELACPFPDMVTCAAAAAVRAAGTAMPRIGVMMTDGLLRTGLYQSAMVQAGGICVLPDEDQQAAIMGAIYTIKTEGATAAATRTVEGVVRHLRSQNCTAVIAGCTELPLVTGVDPQIIDPMAAVAEQILHTLRLNNAFFS